MADSEFTFSTNLPAVASSIERELANITRSINQAQAAAGRPGNIGFVQGLQDRLQAIGRQAQAQLTQLGERMGQAQTRARITGGPVQWEGPSFQRQAADVGRQAHEQFRTVMAQAAQALPEGMNVGDLQRVAATGSQALSQGIRQLYNTMRQELNELTAQARAAGQAIPAIGRLDARGFAAAAQASATVAAPATQLNAIDAEVARQQFLRTAARSVTPETRPSRTVQDAFSMSEADLADKLAASVRRNTDVRGQLIDPLGARFTDSGRGVIDEFGQRFTRTPEGAIPAEAAHPFIDPRMEATQAQQVTQVREQLTAQQEATRILDQHRAGLAQRVGTQQRYFDAEGRLWQLRQNADGQTLAYARDDLNTRRTALEQLERHQQREGQRFAQQRNSAEKVNVEVDRQAREQALYTQTMAQHREGAVRQIRNTRQFIDPATDRVFEARRGVPGQPGQAFEVEGLDRVRAANTFYSQQRADAARALRDEARDRRVANREELGKRGIIGQFAGGFAQGAESRGFGQRDDGTSTAFNIGANFGNVAKYALLYQAFNLASQGAREFVTAAADIGDSLTDLDVAMGGSVDVTQSYVNTLSQFNRLTGGSVAESADAAARGIRAFGSAAGETESSMEATGEASAEAAARLAILTGKPLKDATGDIIAIGAAFGLTANQLERINEAVAGAKPLGGDPQQVAQGLANFAAVAEEAGFTLDQAAGMLSLVQARTDRTGTAIATSIGSALNIMRSAGGQGVLQELARDFGDVDFTGNLASQLQELARIAPELQRQGVLPETLARLGGRGGVRELTVLLTNYGEVVDNVAVANQRGGQAQEEINRQQANFAGLLRRLAGDMQNIVGQVLGTQLLAPIGALLAALDPVLRTVGDILGVFNLLPDSVQAVLAAVLELTVAMRVLGATNFGQALFARGGALLSRAPAAAAPAMHGATMVSPLLPRAGGAAAGVQASITGAAMASAPLHMRAIQGMQTGYRAATGMLANTGRALAAFAASPAGLITGVVGAVVAVNQLRIAVEEMGEAAEQAAEAQRALAGAQTAEELRSAQEGLRAAAEQRRDADSGFFAAVGRNLGFRGTAELIPSYEEATEPPVIQPGYGRQVGDALMRGVLGPLGDVSRGIAAVVRGEGVEGYARSMLLTRPEGLAYSEMEAADQAAALDQAASAMDERLEALEKEAAAASALGGMAVFGGILETAEQLQEGMQRLEASGFSAAVRLERLNEAFSEVGLNRALERRARGGPQPGTIRAGMAGAAGAAIAGRVLATSVVEEGAEGEEDIWGAYRASLVQYFQAQGESLADAHDSARSAMEDVTFFGDPRTIEQAQAQVQALVQDYISEVGLTQGGVLDDAQRQELARRIAHALSGDLDPEQLRLLQQNIFEAVGRATDPAAVLATQEMANTYQAQTIEAASAVGREAQVRGATDAMAAEAELTALREAETNVLRSGLAVTDALRLAILETIRAREDALQAERDAMSGLREAQLPEEDVAGRAAIQRARLMDQRNTAMRNRDMNRVRELTGEIETHDRQVARDLVEQRNAMAEAAIDPRDVRAAAMASLDATLALMEVTPALDSFGNQTAAYSALLIQYAQDVENVAQINRRQAAALRLATRDPRDVLGLAADDVANAQAEADAQIAGSPEQAEAEFEVRSRQQDSRRRRVEMELALARSMSDPENDIQQINLDILEAQRMLELELPGQAAFYERLFTLNELKARRADLERENASELAASEADLDIARLEGGGHDVAARQRALQEARRRLRDAEAEGDQAGINQARADVVRAETAVGDAILSEQLATIDFLLEIGDLTTSQAIEQLQAILRAGDLTEEERRNLILKIRGLEGDIRESLTASGFNIPTEINMPTAYQVRRSLGVDPFREAGEAALAEMMNAGGGGSGYLNVRSAGGGGTTVGSVDQRRVTEVHVAPGAIQNVVATPAQVQQVARAVLQMLLAEGTLAMQAQAAVPGVVGIR